MNRSEAGKLGYAKTGERLLIINREISERKRREYEADPKRCKNCGVVIGYEKRGNKFCSRQCFNPYRTGMSGLKSSHRNETNYCPSCGRRKNQGVDVCQRCREPVGIEAIKKRVAIGQGWACGFCGNTKWNGEDIPLEIHHIDGDHKNNDKDNLILLCPNCHALTPNYKNKNRGGGRIDRRIRRLGVRFPPLAHQ